MLKRHILLTGLPVLLFLSGIFPAGTAIASVSSPIQKKPTVTIKISGTGRLGKIPVSFTKEVRPGQVFVWKRIGGVILFDCKKIFSPLNPKKAAMVRGARMFVRGSLLSLSFWSEGDRVSMLATYTRLDGVLQEIADRKTECGKIYRTAHLLPVVDSVTVNREASGTPGNTVKFQVGPLYLTVALPKGMLGALPLIPQESVLADRGSTLLTAALLDEIFGAAKERSK